MTFRQLKADEIEVRIGQAIKTAKWQGVTLLLYKDARCDMNILDETVGVENWQRKHYELKGNIYCSVGIWCDDKKQWVWKDDVGTESNTEKEKGESSDSFKRACVNLGIGRELYTAPNIMVACELDEFGKKPKDRISWYVKQIAYENNAISGLVVAQKKRGEPDSIVFRWGIYAN